MDDPSATRGDNARRAEICEEVGRVVSSAWQHQFGVRPRGISTEYVGDVVRCSITETEATEAEEAVPAATASTASSYERDAQIAVSRVTGRKVVGFIAKPAGDKNPMTNAFILERAHRRI